MREDKEKEFELEKQKAEMEKQRLEFEMQKTEIKHQHWLAEKEERRLREEWEHTKGVRRI